MNAIKFVSVRYIRAESVKTFTLSKYTRYIVHSVACTSSYFRTIEIIIFVSSLNDTYISGHRIEVWGGLGKVRIYFNSHS